MKEISAGGVVYKREGDQTYILMIEDRYQKLTIPKGKIEAGETLEETAIREIAEETGVNGRIIQPLKKVYYQYTDPRRGLIDKEVSYYLVEALSGTIVAQIEEINKVFWVEIAKTKDLVYKSGYENNYEIFDLALAYLQNEKHNIQ